MPKGKYQRKLRGVDYSKKEIAKQLQYSENMVDNWLEQLRTDYNWEDGFFKREGNSGLYYFPPEYTPLLIELLKHNASNPATPRDKKHVNVKAEDVANYNDKLIKSIQANQEIPQYMKDWMETMPWMRTAEDIISLIELLVTELQLFIHNTLDTNNSDVGQALRIIIRDLDAINYRMFCGNQFSRWCMACDDSDKEIVNKGIFLELCEKSEEEREKCFKEVPSTRAIYNKYAGRQEESESVQLDAKDLSLDQGILATIRTLMRYGDARQLQRGERLEPDEYTFDENNDFERNEARRAYLDAKKGDVLAALAQGCSSGYAAINRSGNEWKCIADKIKDREEIILEKESQSEAIGERAEMRELYQQLGLDMFDEFLDLEYLEYYDNIENNDSKLRDIVSNFIGRLLVDYFFASKKK